jgi:hypothetical protein
MTVAFVENGVVVGMALDAEAQQLGSQYHPQAEIVVANEDLAFDPATHVLQEAYPYIQDGVVYSVRAVLLSDANSADTISAA